MDPGIAIGSEVGVRVQREPLTSSRLFQGFSKTLYTVLSVRESLVRGFELFRGFFAIMEKLILDGFLWPSEY